MDQSVKPAMSAAPKNQRSSPPATRAEMISAAPVHRRAFLGWFGVGGAATAVAASLPATTAEGVTNLIFNRGQLMLNEVTHAGFAEFVGDPFRFELAAGEFVEARLAEVNLLKHPQPVRADDRRAPFSLIFQVPTSGALPQHIYALEHAKLGRMEIFLVPVGRDAGNLLLEAIFN